MAEKPVKSERLYGDLLNAMADAIQIIDRDFRILLFNDACTQMAKSSGFEADVVGKNLFECFPFLDQKVRSEYEQVFASGEVLETEEDNSFNGQTVFTRTRKIPIHENGKVVRIVTVITDLTEEKITGQKLRDRVERFRLLYERSPLGYQSLDENGCFITVNSAWLEMLGFGKEEVIGKWFGDFLVPEQVELFQGRFPKFKTRGETRGVYFKMVHKDGSVIDVEFNGKIGLDEKGKFKQTHCVLNDISDRKKAEEALRQSEEKYRTLVETSQDLIWKCDELGRFTYLNPAWESTHGYKLEEMLGRPFTDFEAREIKQHDLEEFRRHLEGGSVVGYETCHISKSGEEIYLVFNALPLYDNAGKIVGTHGTAHDVTYRKHAEEALKKSEEKYRQIVETADEGIWFIDADTNTTFANQKIAQMLGYTIEEMETMSMLDLTDDKWRAIAEENFQQVIAGKSMQFDFKFKRKDGSDLWSIVATNPFHDENGKFIGALGMVTDITERKQTEEELAKVNLLLGTILDTTYSLIAYLDPQFNFVRVNNAYAEADEKDITYFPGKNHFDLFPNQENEEIFQAVVQTSEPYFAVEKPFSFEKHPERGVSYWDWSLIPIKSESAEVTGLVLTLQNVTSRVQARDQLKTHRDRLAVVNKELETFAYTVSHDLKAPLRQIEGFSTLLSEQITDKISEQEKQYLQRINKTTFHMSSLITDILKFSQLTQKELVLSKVDLSYLAHTLAEQLQQAQPEREVKFIIKKDLLVNGDEGLLRNVLENLIDNAWKFTQKQPEAEIEIGVKKQKGKKTYFVKDNGIGYDPAKSHKLFTAFQRLHAEKEFQGTGIGLASVKKIIERHGGKVWAEGEIGKGATFYFTLD